MLLILQFCAHTKINLHTITMKKFVLAACALLMGLFASAHALWIETEAKGIRNKQHQVRVYLGEFGDNERDSVINWFSNMKEIELFVTDPSGNKQKITLRDAGNHYSGVFTPASDGNYTLSVAHTVADIYSEGKIQYYATAGVLVGKSSHSALSTAALLSVVPSASSVKTASPLNLQVFMQGQPVEKAKVMVISPDGWEKTMYSNAEGKAVCAPVQPGQHMLEVVKIDKTPGTHNGKAYKSVTHLVTHCVQVQK